MQGPIQRFVLAAGMLTLVAMAHAASPVEQARERAVSTFAQTEDKKLPVNPAVVNGAWNEVPFDQAPFTYTFDEIRENWDYFMRGLRIPYPSPEWLKSRFERFPGLMHELGYQDRNWKMHSLNVLEAWQAFLRGDFKKARDLGIRYGGYAEVPGVFAQLIYGVYLTDTLEEKQMHLQDTLTRIQHYGTQFPYLPGEGEFHEDYVMLRLGLAYAYGRLTEDAPLAKAMADGYAVTTINAVTEALAVAPDHALALALNAAFDSNVIRRVGKTAGRVALGAKPINAVELFKRALALQGDMAILRYEYANTLLYVDEPEAEQRAVAQLEKAISVKPGFAMEMLDRQYARKRLEEVRAWQGTDMSFGAFDKRRRQYMHDNDINLYSVLHDPFIAAN
jgi:hypothetical protein